MPDALKTGVTLVRDCSAPVWIYPAILSDGRLHFHAESNTAITKGIIALVLATVQDRTPQDILATDIEAALAPFDLATQLSSNRTQGIPNMIALIRHEAAPRPDRFWRTRLLPARAALSRANLCTAPPCETAARRAFSFLERYPNRFILSIRFIYGLRTLSPIAVGASHIPQARFPLLNAVAAVVWAMLFSVLGYQVGDALRVAFRRVHPYSHVSLAAFAIGLALFVSFRLLCRYLHHRAGERGAATAIGMGGSPKLG